MHWREPSMETGAIHENHVPTTAVLTKPRAPSWPPPCFVNYTELMTDPSQRYLEAQIRAHFPFHGLPLRFDIRERRREEQPRPAARRASEHARKRRRTEARPAPSKKNQAAPARTHAARPRSARRR